MSEKKKFGFDTNNIISFPGGLEIQKVIFENNKEFSYVQEFANPGFCIVLCENQPRDMGKFGIKWEELK